jgi:periplasmic protein TonB
MKFSVTFLFIFLCSQGFSQKKNMDDKFYLFDKEWKNTEAKNAVYFLRVRQTSDSSWEWLVYNIFGPRISKELYKDSKATIKNGKCLYYYPGGTIDSSGTFVDGLQDKDWLFLDLNSQLIRKKTYNHGLLLTDSTFIPKKPDPSKKEEIKPGEVESEYPGGDKGWARFLGKNFIYPERALNNNIQGEVRIMFIIDKEGNTTDPEINKSVEYSLDEETIRIIHISGKWTPAVQAGRIVRSYKIQPVIFKLR